MTRSVLFMGLCVFSVGAAAAPRTPQVIVQGFCVSNTAPAVYVTGVVDLQTRTAAAGALSVFRQFSEYLRGRYNFDTTPLGVGCQAEQTRTATLARLRKEGHEVVQVDWKPAPLDHNDLPPAAPGPSDHVWCFSRFSPDTLYVTGPVQVPPSQASLASWNSGFLQHLKQKYGYQGAVDCNADRANIAKAMVTNRIDGARAGQRKIVDTMWRAGNERMK